MSDEFFSTFSVILDYPIEGSAQFAKDSVKQLEKVSPEAAALVDRFADEALSKSVYDLEELYTRTFDIQGRACLDVGYVLFGEDYKRGQFLVTIKSLCKDHDLDTRVELPDHLTNMLRLLEKMNDGSRKELCEKVIMPALEKILEHFGPDGGGEDLYVGTLHALKSYLNNIYQMNKTIFGGPVC